MNNPNAYQVDGSHYKGAGNGNYQHWDFVKEQLDNRYFEGMISKYLFRHKRKNGVVDLEKAKHFADKLLELATLHPDGEYPSMNSIRERYGSFELYDTKQMTRMSLIRSTYELDMTESAILLVLCNWKTTEHLRWISGTLQLLIDRAYETDSAEPQAQGYTNQG